MRPIRRFPIKAIVLALTLAWSLGGPARAAQGFLDHRQLRVEAGATDSPPNNVILDLWERFATSSVTLHRAIVTAVLDIATEPYFYIATARFPNEIVKYRVDDGIVYAEVTVDFLDGQLPSIQQCDRHLNCKTISAKDLPDSFVHMTWVMTPAWPSGAEQLDRVDMRGSYTVDQDVLTGAATANGKILGYQVQTDPTGPPSAKASVTLTKSFAVYPPDFHYPLPPDPQFFCIYEVCGDLWPPTEPPLEGGK